MWEGAWIAHPTEPDIGYGVYRFRKTFSLAQKPMHFLVRVSGDRRYRLFVNGTAVAVGPQRGDRSHWYYEVLDLAPQLHAGANVLASTVWNYGLDCPVALNSVRTGFIVDGAGEAEKVVNTGPGWRVFRETAYTALSADRMASNVFTVVGPGDRVDGSRLVWRWAEVDFDDSAWPHAQIVGSGTPEGVGTEVDWWLTPRTIPLPFERTQRFAAIREQSGPSADGGLLRGKRAWMVPAHCHARLLLDNGVETNAFPRLRVSGGRGGICRLTYAEALVDAAGAKGNRDDVLGRHIVGMADEFLPDGGNDREFTTLTFRSYRYVELVIETGDQALTIEDILALATGYPFEHGGSFTSSDPRLDRIWEVGVRTAQLCAYETYFDCPYYEQLQYVGDTRIQGLISLYAFGDDRLLRNAIEQFDRSRQPCGLTQSRFPATKLQIIPPFSLLWVQMVHDYWQHRVDDSFVCARLLGLRDVLAWFEGHVDPTTGLLGPLPYWNFVDWPKEWPWINGAVGGGFPPNAREGGSAILTLQYACALADAAELSEAYGCAGEAARWRGLQAKLAAAVRARCWDAGRRLFADTATKTSWSQHVNALAVLAGVIAGPEATDLMRRVRDDPALTQCTLYFRFYLLRAAKKAGLGEDYLHALGPWFDMLRRGLTTFAEQPEPTRSDCHAWSASPVYELLATVCGVEPGAPGFRRVRIEPLLGDLNEAHGRVPHPAGTIEVDLRRTAKGTEVEITLPGQLSGTLIWKGQSIELLPGHQRLEL